MVSLAAEKSLRVLVVLPLYGGSLPVGRYAARALHSLGHTVEVFEAPGFHAAFTALKGLKVSGRRLEQLENSFLQLTSEAVLAKVESFEPDMVLALAQAPLSRRALQQLSRDKVATAMWFVEDHAVFTYWRAFAPLYDIFAVIQKEPFLGLLEEVGVDNALYLPLAADPEFHRPVELTPLERRQYGSDLSFVGAGYPNRRRVFARLMQYDLKIWGSDWDGELTLAGRLQRGGARIEPEEAVKIFNASSINLNLHSSLARDGQVVAGDFVNPRTFELAACGAFQLVDRRTLLGELFGDDELGVFEDVDQLTDLIGHYLPRPEERKEYSRRARERVLQEHTYDRRMHSLIEFTARRLPDWPRERGSEADWPELPPDLHQELSGLLDRLGLPATVAFKDLVWAVRSQQGRLSRLETAILFLDEWQKQYGRRS